MLRWIMVAAILFWVMLLGLALVAVFAGNFPITESFYLIGIPTVMIIMTVVTKRVAKDSHLAPGAVAGGSVLAGLALLMVIGILGAGV